MATKGNDVDLELRCLVRGQVAGDSTLARANPPRVVGFNSPLLLSSSKFPAFTPRMQATKMSTQTSNAALPQGVKVHGQSLCLSPVPGRPSAAAAPLPRRYRKDRLSRDVRGLPPLSPRPRSSPSTSATHSYLQRRTLHELAGARPGGRRQSKGACRVPMRWRHRRRTGNRLAPRVAHRFRDPQTATNPCRVAY